MTPTSPAAEPSPRPGTPGHTRVAAYALCVDERERILLVRLSDRTTRAGSWTLPGGGVDFGEHPEAGALRELSEETGLTGQLTGLLAVDSIVRDLDEPDAPSGRYHSVRIVYRAEITGGQLRDEPHGESSDHAEWIERADADALDLVELGALGVRLAYAESAPRERGQAGRSPQRGGNQPV